MRYGLRRRHHPQVQCRSGSLQRASFTTVTARGEPSTRLSRSASPGGGPVGVKLTRTRATAARPVNLQQQKCLRTGWHSRSVPIADIRRTSSTHPCRTLAIIDLGDGSCPFTDLGRRADPSRRAGWKVVQMVRKSKITLQLVLTQQYVFRNESSISKTPARSWRKNRD